MSKLNVVRFLKAVSDDLNLQRTLLDAPVEMAAWLATAKQAGYEFSEDDLHAVTERVTGKALVPNQTIQTLRTIFAGVLSCGGLLATIADTLYEVGSDILAIGPDASALVENKIGGSLPERLGRLNEELEQIRNALLEVRADFLQRELAKSSITTEKTGLKLHLGAGRQRLSSWVNIDFFPAEFCLNLNWDLPFADASADYVFFSHVLEHLYYPDGVAKILGEVARVLRLGGVLRVIVPDIEKCIRAYSRDDREFFENRKKFWPWAGRLQTKLEHFLEYAGANQRAGAMWIGHKFGFDFETLALALERAGFRSVRHCDYMQSEHPELRIDDASVVAGAAHGNEHYSLFVEATR